MRKKKTETKTEKTEKTQKQETQAPVVEELIIKPVDEDDEVIKGSVGYDLRKARQRKKKDIQKIAAQLLIKPCYLEALEQSKYKEFPGQAYAFGFLRTYADYLGLDTDNLIMRYRQERSFIEPEKMDMPIPPSKQELLPSAKYLFWGILVIALVWAFWYFVTYAKQNLPALQQQAQKPVPTEITEDQPMEVISVLPIEAEQPQQNTLEQTALAEEPKIESKLKVEQPKAENTKKEEKTSEKNRIRIVATQNVWIEISEGDTIVASKFLQKGDSYDVPKNSEKMLLKTGNAGGMDVFVDGKKIKGFGSVGSVKSGISLSPDKLKNR